MEQLQNAPFHFLYTHPPPIEGFSTKFTPNKKKIKLATQSPSLKVLLHFYCGAAEPLQPTLFKNSGPVFFSLEHNTTYRFTFSLLKWSLKLFSKVSSMAAEVELLLNSISFILPLLSRARTTLLLRLLIVLALRLGCCHCCLAYWTIFF